MVMVIKEENAMVRKTAEEQKETAMAFTRLSHLHCLLSRPPDPRSRKNRERSLIKLPLRDAQLQNKWKSMQRRDLPR